MGLWTEYILVQGYISSLQSVETEDIRMTMDQFCYANWIMELSSDWVGGHPQSCHSLAGKIPAGAGVVTGKTPENTIRRRKTSHQRASAVTHRQRDVMQHYSSWSEVWLMKRRALPACWSWATAVSAVEQKPHEGSVSQHKKQTHSDSTIIKQDDLCVLFGSGTVETAEEQDHWKAAHSFNL